MSVKMVGVRNFREFMDMTETEPLILVFGVSSVDTFPEVASFTRAVETLANAPKIGLVNDSVLCGNYKKPEEPCVAIVFSKRMEVGKVERFSPTEESVLQVRGLLSVA